MIDEKTLGGVAPNEADLDRAYALAVQWIEAAFTAFPILEEVRNNPALLPDYRATNRSHSLLLKPAGQIALFRAARIAREEMGTSFSIEQFMRATTSVDWSVESAIWENILVQGRSRILAKRQNYEDAAHLIVGLCFSKQLPNPERLLRQLQIRWEKANPDLPLPSATN
jgi:hypothetical protein